ncbi:MAG: TrkH family potassium uptake protein, partial [Planctomycetota bacterium]
YPHGRGRTDDRDVLAALFFAWIILLAIGGGATALLSDHGPIESASGMFSALGNIGPCYISVRGVTELHPVIKLTYILGMLAGRLEILPVLLLFSRRTWR